MRYKEYDPSTKKELPYSLAYGCGTCGCWIFPIMAFLLSYFFSWGEEISPLLIGIGIGCFCVSMGLSNGPMKYDHEAYYREKMKGQIQGDALQSNYESINSVNYPTKNCPICGEEILYSNFVRYSESDFNCLLI
jgi:hypothetical protein